MLWIRPTRPKAYNRVCPFCKETCWNLSKKEYPYCPWCGKKMEHTNKCGECKYLDLEDKSTIGYKCHRPNYYSRSSTARWKYTCTPACVGFVKRKGIGK